MRERIRYQTAEAGNTNTARANNTAAPVMPNSVMCDILGSLSGEQQNLEQAMKDRMRERFGVEMPGLRVYEDKGLGELGQRGYARGNEIHLAEGEFDQHSESGRELLYHEAGHVVQQGMGLARGNGILDNPALEAQAGEVAAPPQNFSMPAAASGPVQGWNPFKGIMNKLKGNKNAPQTPQETQTQETPQQDAPQTPQPEIPQPEMQEPQEQQALQQIPAEPAPLKSLRDRFYDSKKVSGGDSSEFLELRGALSNVTYLNYNSENFAEERPEHLEEFNTLISYCERYISSHKNPITGRGKERLAIARQTLQQALADRAALMTYEPGADAGNRPLLEALAEHSRGEVIDAGGQMPDFVGGQASQRFKVTSGGKDAFFSKEERVDDKLKESKPATYNTTVGEHKGRLKHGDIISNRNVGMSRMAKLLGVEDVLANSKNATMKVGGETIKGNVMEKARGKAAGDFTKEEISGADSGIFTGNIQRQLMNLQVLDTICAQVDRHMGNYFMSATRDENGKVTSLDSLQGIDNDLAFGSWSMGDLDKAAMSVEGGNTNAKGLKMTQGKGQDTLPLMDKALADRIEALDTDTIKYHMADIITDPEQMNALLGRFEDMKSYVGTLKDKDGKPKDGAEGGAARKTLLNPEDWGEESYDILMEDMMAENGQDFSYNSNYLKNLNYTLTNKQGLVDMKYKWDVINNFSKKEGGQGDLFKKQKQLRQKAV